MLRKIFRKIFSIHRPSKEWVNIPSNYIERDTKCDLCTCEKKDECDLINVTTSMDKKVHYDYAPFYMCPLKESIDE